MLKAPTLTFFSEDTVAYTADFLGDKQQRVSERVRSVKKGVPDK